MNITKKWEDMTWQEKREERFKRWLNPPDVIFANSRAEKLYKERVTSVNRQGKWDTLKT